MDIKISDDPSEVKPIFEELRNNFYLNVVQKVEFREKALGQLIKGYKELQPELDEALKQDCGYNPFMANFVAHNITINEAEHLLKNIRKWSKPRPVDTPVTVGLASSQVEYEPLGVALVLSAWNYPIYTAVPQVAAAISAGNCVILKPSELAPYTSRVLKKLFEKYMDPRFYRVIEGKVEVAKALTKQKLDIICFTGSTETGRLVAIQAAKNLTPCILELGGKCPVIVDETANLHSAAIRIIFGKYINSGQTCVAADHIYIHQKVYKDFKKILLEEIKQAFDNQDNINSGDYGKINNIKHLKRLEKMLKEEHGGSVLYGGNIVQDKLHFSPTIVEQPKKDSQLMQQEIFGPIMPIFTYSSLKQVIQQIRTRAKPLIVYCFSQNKSNIDYVKTHTYSGAFVVNDVIIHMLNNHLPFGGVGQSGYGRYHGQSGFIGFSNPKSLCYTKAFNAYPLSTRFFPYTDSKKRVLSFLFKTSNVTYSHLRRSSTVLAVVIAAAYGYLKMRPLL